MIRLEDTPIADIKLGEESILEVFKGEERIWGGIYWNQLKANGNFSEGTNGLSSYNSISPNIEYSVEDNILTMHNNGGDGNGSISFSLPSKYIKHNDKILLLIDAKTDEAINTSATGVVQVTIFGTIKYIRQNEIGGLNTDWKRCYMFHQAPSVESSTSSSWGGMIYSRDKNTTKHYKNFMIFNLTLMYGEGREPNTLEEFLSDYKKWFGKELEYEEYCEGKWLDIK